MTLQLPPPVADYFAADFNDDPDRLLRAFAPDAEVIDEGRRHAGHHQIAAWKAEASARYRYVATPFSVIHEAGGRVTVAAHLVGDFPGSPLDLRYRFTLTGDRIAVLEIAP